MYPIKRTGLFLLVVLALAAAASPQARRQRELDRGLYEAARRGEINRVNAAMNGDGSALIAAARKGNIEMARLLLDRGANPNTGVEGDGSPLIVASGGRAAGDDGVPAGARRHSAIVSFLLSAGARE